MKNLSAIILLFTSLFAVGAVAEPQANKTGELVIYRSADQSATDYRVLVDGKYLGKLKRKKSISLQLPAGDHIVSMNDRDKTQLTVSITANKVSYVKKFVNSKGKATLEMSQPDADSVAKIVTNTRQLAFN